LDAVFETKQDMEIAAKHGLAEDWLADRILTAKSSFIVQEIFGALE